MRLANIEANGASHVAILAGEELVDMTAQVGAWLDDVAKLLALGGEARPLAEKCVRAAKSRLARSAVRLRPAVLAPGKIVGVGMNYHSFVAAARRCELPLPQKLVWFYRPSACLSAPYADVWLPRTPCELEYEGELAVVVGRCCRSVSATHARTAIGGFTVANDLTIRDRIPESFVFAKSFETHTPLGPWLVTVDEIDDPHDLGLKTWVNGELRQNSSTADMIVNCYDLIAKLSEICTLNPGDVILTGSPDGVGMFQNPPSCLKAGDVVKIEIAGIGTIENRIVGEPS